MGKAYILEYKQRVAVPAEKVWDFIASPSNLKKITPPYMGFDITFPEKPVKMYEGMIITYIVTPLAGLRLTWVTEITHVKEGQYFVDDQRSGPYALWHHQHFIESDGDETVMTDIVTYLPPFGIFGRIANLFFIRRRLKEIFDYREEALKRWSNSFKD